MSTREERAELRRRTWQGGVAHSFEEADQQDLEFWMAATPSERVRGLTELLLGMPWTETNDGPPGRLQRAVGGVRPLKG